MREIRQQQNRASQKASYLEFISTKAIWQRLEFQEEQGSRSNEVRQEDLWLKSKAVVPKFE